MEAERIDVCHIFVVDDTKVITHDMLLQKLLSENPLKFFYTMVYLL